MTRLWMIVLRILKECLLTYNKINMKENENFENLIILYLISVISIFASLEVLAYCGVLK